ncbi:MAG: hypothetical protein E7Y34_02095, partial [Mycoplasma sp.]|nr:hypothetical protein [Mycoplasma sp.]
MVDTYKDNLTRASISMLDFMSFYGRNNFANDFGGFKWDYRNKKSEYHNVLTKDQWEFIRDSYSGGYVSWPKKIQNKDIYCEKGVALDVNSLFPSVMVNNHMPYGQCYSYKVDETCVELIGVWIKSAIKKDPKFPSLIKDNTGSTYTSIKYLDEITAKTWRVYWREEFDLINSVYLIDYTIDTSYWFKTKDVFSQWINDKYHLKQYAPTKGEREMHKGILNSLYGKFAQHYIRESKILVPLLPDKKVRKDQVVYGRGNKRFIFENI